MTELVLFEQAMNSGKPFRREGSTCAEGMPLWWTRDEVEQLLDGTDADGFMRLLTVREWEVSDDPTVVD